jgi:copper homeostasis protein
LILIEAAVETVESALAAERGGANRIELCADLSDGGTTPGAELIAAVSERTRVPVLVMIRPRTGGFVYSDDEIEAMSRDIELARRIGVAGIVTGPLTSHGRIDVAQTRTLLSAAAGLPVTFHRAFDMTADPVYALEQLIDLGVSRVLTAGGATTAADGADAIAALVDHARRRIAVIAGGGIREQNVRNVISRTGVGEIHTRFIDEPSMRGLVDLVMRG